MTTIIITALILIILALTIKVFKQGIYLDGYRQAEDFMRIDLMNSQIKATDKHPWTNGDCCRCLECTDRYHKEIIK